MAIPSETGPDISRQPDGSYSLDMTSVIRRPREEVFATLADPRNIERMVPSWIVFSPEEKLMPKDMREGTVINYSLKVRWLRGKWRSEITEWSPPEVFTDIQVDGPFTEWRDRHTFTEAGDGVTVVRNEICYRVPGSFLVHRLFVRSNLLKIYRYERRMMHRLLDEDEAG